MLLAGSVEGKQGGREGRRRGKEGKKCLEEGDGRGGGVVFSS